MAVTRAARKAALKSYKKHAKNSHCKTVKRLAVCKRTSGCKVTKKTAKKITLSSRKSKTIILK